MIFNIQVLFRIISLTGLARCSFLGVGNLPPKQEAPLKRAIRPIVMTRTFSQLPASCYNLNGMAQPGCGPTSVYTLITTLQGGAVPKSTAITTTRPTSTPSSGITVSISNTGSATSAPVTQISNTTSATASTSTASSDGTRVRLPKCEQVIVSVGVLGFVLGALQAWL